MAEGIAVAADAPTAESRQRALDLARLVFGEGYAYDSRVVPYQRTVAREAASNTRGNRVDRLIAAVARANGLPLLTLDPGDLRGVSGVVDLRPLSQLWQQSR